MSSLSAVLAELRIADAQPANWYGWATNQAGHFALVGVPGSLAAMWADAPGYVIPLLVAGVYFFAWELLIQGGKDLADSIMDTLMVACGAALVVAVATDLKHAGVAYIAYAVLTGIGVWRRI